MWISCFFWWPFVATYFEEQPAPKLWTRCQLKFAKSWATRNSCAKISPTNSWISVPGPYDKFHGGFEITKHHFGSRRECSDDWTIGHVTCDHASMCVFSLFVFFWWGEKRQKDTNGRFGTWLNVFRFVVSDVFVFGLFSVIDVCWNPVVDRYVLDFMVYMYTDILGESQKSAQGGPKNHL